jgi:hypothetical protein
LNETLRYWVVPGLDVVVVAVLSVAKVAPALQKSSPEIRTDDIGRMVIGHLAAGMMSSAGLLSIILDISRKVVILSGDAHGGGE